MAAGSKKFRKKKRDRRRWNGVSTSGRAARIARKQRSRKSARSGWRNPYRSSHYGAK